MTLFQQAAGIISQTSRYDQPIREVPLSGLRRTPRRRSEIQRWPPALRSGNQPDFYCRLRHVPQTCYGWACGTASAARSRAFKRGRDVPATFGSDSRGDHRAGSHRGGGPYGRAVVHRCQDPVVLVDLPEDLLGNTRLGLSRDIHPESCGAAGRPQALPVGVLYGHGRIGAALGRQAGGEPTARHHSDGFAIAAEGQILDQPRTHPNAHQRDRAHAHRRERRSGPRVRSRAEIPPMS